MRHAFLKAACFFMLLFCFVTANAQQPGYIVHLTNKFEAGKPDTEPMMQFDCSDRIHLVITAAGLSKEKHELKALWFDPTGERKEMTRYKFDAMPITQVWAWLQLHGPTGAIVGQMFDPSFGMEEFIGEWRVDVLIDGTRIAEQKFRVLC